MADASKSKSQLHAFLVASMVAHAAHAGGSDFLLAVSPGVDVPNIEDLTTKVEESLAVPAGRRTVRMGDRWIEAAPPAPKSATVLAYSEKERIARVEFSHPAYAMRIIKFWRFDGRTWSDRMDPGMRG